MKKLSKEIQIYSLTAGPELDALIASHLMAGDGPLPAYSTDIADAWRVIEAMREEYVIALNDVQGQGGWWVEFQPKKYVGSLAFGTAIGVRAQTCPLAICRAAALSMLQRDL